MYIPPVDIPVKLVVLGVLFLSSILFSSMPFLVAKRVKDTLLLFSALNCLSGGVVLGAALSHMLPDAQDNFDAFWEAEKASVPARIRQYPFPSLIAATGLLILICIDRTLLGAHSHAEVVVETPPKERRRNEGIVNSTEHSHSSGSCSCTAHNTSYGAGDAEAEESVPLIADNFKVDIGFSTSSLNQQVDHFSVRGTPTKSAVTKAWIFLAALSVHSVLEGLGIGAENEKNAFYSVLLAVMAHKCLEAFALGLSVYYANFANMATLSLLIGYSFATPIGIAAGMVVANLSRVQNFIAGALVSLAAGSFLYISLIEILPTELRKPHGMGIKIGCMITGWAGMAILAYYA